jgi:hypothetical protein
MAPEMIPLSGNTYPIRKQLKSLGGEFNSAAKAWMLPADRIAEARKLLGNGRGEPGSQRGEKPTSRGNPEFDLQQFEELLRAQFAILRSEVMFAGRWDDDAERRIVELEAKLKAKGRDISWVDRTIEEFRRKLGERKRSWS